jgi:hypothetical protein
VPFFIPEPSANDVLLPPTGRPRTQLLVCCAPLSYSAGCGDLWSAHPIYRDLNAEVADGMVGLDVEEVKQVVLRHFTSSLAAIARTTRAVRARPATAAAARSVRRLATQIARQLAVVAPGGTSALVLADFGLPALLSEHGRGKERGRGRGGEVHRAPPSKHAPLAALPADLPPLPPSSPPAGAIAAAIHSQSAAGDHSAAFATARAGLQLLSHLRFGSRTDAEPFRAAALTFHHAVAAAVAAGVPVVERDAAELTAACRRAHGFLQMSSWFGHAYGNAVEAFSTRG